MADLAQTRAIILAAGAGRRMGTPKALMTIDGAPWWQMQSARLDAIGAPALWVVSERVTGAMPGDHPTPRVIADENAPMLASVLAGARALDSDPPTGVFILPIDTPAPRKNVWEALAGSDTPASPLVGEQGGHPVYCPWGWVRDHLLGAHIDPMTDRLDALLGKDLRRIPVDDPDAITNLNRPDDLDSWRRRTRSAT